MFTENTGVLYGDSNVFEPYMTIMRETILSLQKKLGFMLISVLNHPECKLGGSIHTLKENAEALVAATREIGLEVSADKTKYMVLSRDQNAGRIQSVRNENSTFERVEVFKYLGKNLTNQNSIAEEIKSRLKSGNACYHSTQNLLSSRLLSKNLKIKIHRIIILPVVLYGCET